MGGFMNTLTEVFLFVAVGILAGFFVLIWLYIIAVIKGSIK